MLAQEVVLERFKKVHGDLYDYSGVVYKGKDAKVAIGCSMHGTFMQSPHNHCKGQGCPICGDLKQAANTTRTTEQFVALAREKHGDVYDYSNVEYVKGNKNVSITCRAHGDFSMKPVNHLIGQGCSKCYRERQAAKQAYDTETYVEKAKKKHGDKFDYSLVEYRRSVDKISIICKEHGVFVQEAASHLTGIGCPKCADKVRAELRTKDTSAFVESAKIVHGELYDYGLVDYKGYRLLVTIVCPLHGPFKQRPITHLTGCGCQRCAKSGFNTDKNGVVYVLRAGNLTKIGITNKSAKSRAKAISASFGNDFEVVRYFPLKGDQCALIESVMLQYLRFNYKSPDVKFDGYSETFVDLDADELIEMLECLV